MNCDEGTISGSRTSVDIETIDSGELKAKLARGDHFRLVMTLHDWALRAAHIPGSIHFHTVEDAYRGLKRDDEIVVYCSNEACVASRTAVS